MRRARRFGHSTASRALHVHDEEIDNYLDRTSVIQVHV